jgi:hypothetical protein
MAKSISNPKGAGRKPLTEKIDKTSLSIKALTKRSIKYISFMDGKTQTDIVEEALTSYITQWEKTNGPIPKK